MRTSRRSLADMVDETTDNGFAQSAPLMLWIYSDIDYLKRQAAVTDNAAHADQPPIDSNGYSEERVRQAESSAFGTAWTQAREDTQATVLVG